MTRLAVWLCVTFWVNSAWVHAAEPESIPSYDAIDEVPHLYRQRPLKDRVSLIRDQLESGNLPLDRSGELPFLLSLLKVLEIPVSSQLLVFSTTSLQLSLISPKNPRAIYFNEDIYVGFIPGGRIELVSLDPALGGVFYIFDIPKPGQGIHLDRSERCMNCHASDETGHVPGLVIKSVMPGPTGGSLTAYRIGQTGHQIPLSERFGGWHLTGASGLLEHHGNLTGKLSDGKLTLHPNPLGDNFDGRHYPVMTSDLLPHLLLEHQAGFVNRAVEATYRARTLLHLRSGSFTPEQAKELEDQAQGIVSYLLFQEEAPLPKQVWKASEVYTREFLKTKRVVNGKSLKDLNLRTRLFELRCSYMIYSPVFDGLPSELKERVFFRLKGALRPGNHSSLGNSLEEDEKRSICDILRATLPTLPPGW